jgi:hypothetical protein
MDASVSAAIVAVGLDDEPARQRWFELICATFDGLMAAGEPDWGPFAAALADGAMSMGIDVHLVEQFVDDMSRNDPSPIRTVSALRELADQLPGLYRELTAGATGDDDAKAAWPAFLSEHAVYWNGDDDTWPRFAAWFCYEAGQRGLGTPAAEFIADAESQPDKAAVFAAHGVPLSTATVATGDGQAAADVSTFPQLEQGQSGEWVDYLDAMLTNHGF